MIIEATLLLIIWFGIGVIVAVHIFLDMKARKKMEKNWVLIGFLLSVIGFLIYHLRIRIARTHPYQYPPKPQYENPEYRLEEVRNQQPAVERSVKKEPESAKKEFVEGLPRCPHCGAAISAHDWDCPHCGAALRH
jgi:hypothetical protein